MGKCDVCHFQSDVREKFAGHMSAHVRRGEVEKRLPRLSPAGTCLICNREFKLLKLHMRSHDPSKRKPFDEIRSDELKKARLIEERGHSCETCHTTTWRSAPVPLQLDHRDGNPTNGCRENLQLICPNCHAQTETYCGKNIGRPKCRNREKAQFPLYRSAEYIRNQLAFTGE